MVKTVVILGAGLAGLPLAHSILKKQADKFDLKVILVSPSDEFYWNLASPRAAIPGQYGDDKVFYSIPDAFSSYKKERFEFVLGKATGWNPAENSVVVADASTGELTIKYETLFVATGSTPKDGQPWKLLGTSGETHAALDKLRVDIERASSIYVGGAGTTGTEFAGELGYEYAKGLKKKVTLICSEAFPLGPAIMESTRATAKKELVQLGVEVVTDTKVTSVSSNEAGATVLVLTRSDGTTSTVTTDLYVSTTGLSFNSGFAPAELRKSNGRLKVNNYLQAPSYNNVFILGDVADLQSPTAAPLDDQLRYLTKALDSYFAGTVAAEYKPSTMTMLGVSVGRERGTGQMAFIKPFSFLIWYAKGRYLGTDYAAEYAAGTKLVKGAW